MTPGPNAYEKTEEKPAEETEVMESEESTDTQTAEPEEKMETAAS